MESASAPRYVRLKALVYLVGIIILASSTAGCLIIPVPASDHKVVAGSRVEHNTISSIKIGQTTRAQIIQALGQPNVDMPELRVIAYLWEQVDYHVLLILLGPNGAGGGEIGGPIPYAFFVAFDQSGRVSSYELEKSRKGTFGWTSIQEAARDWARTQGVAVPDLPSGFVAREIPTGQALLYIYRTGGFFADARGVPPEVFVDGRLEAELKKGTFVSLPEAPGNHTVTVVPARVPPDPGSSVSSDLIPNRKYFLSVTIPWTSAPVKLNFRSEQDATPILAEMSPAR